MITPYFESEYARLYLGNCLDSLAALPEKSVHCVVTSPPYFGLRDYGTGEWEGGDPECDHVGTIKRSVSGGPGKQQSNKGSNEVYSGPCRCGAVRVDNQIGLEPTPEAFVEALVEVLTAVHRVLRDDGTLWLNLGDTFWGSWGNSGNRPEISGKEGSQRPRNVERHSRPAHDERRDRPATSYKRDDIKPKELIGIPWMVAFALRKAGWMIRTDIIWHKPNPMPESAEDRPGRAHEYIFLMTKSRHYYYDHIAVREPASAASLKRIAQPNFAQQSGGAKDYANGVNPNRSARQAVENFAANPGRNKRTVWTVAVGQSREAHFASYPPKLIEPCILAGTSAAGCCAACGAPLVRRVEKDFQEQQDIGIGKRHKGSGKGLDQSNRWGNYPRGHTLIFDSHFVPSCECCEEVIPCTVLDPFSGTATTGAVAIAHKRRYIGLELNPDYMEMAIRRLTRTQPRLIGDITNE